MIITIIICLVAKFRIKSESIFCERIMLVGLSWIKSYFFESAKCIFYPLHMHYCPLYWEMPRRLYMHDSYIKFMCCKYLCIWFQIANCFCLSCAKLLIWVWNLTYKRLHSFIFLFAKVVSDFLKGCKMLDQPIFLKGTCTPWDIWTDEQTNTLYWG